MKFLPLLVPLTLLCSGCVFSQKQGTEWNPTAANQQNRVVTYVTPEEYDRMTPEERERLHATVGVQASAGFGRQIDKTTDGFVDGTRQGAQECGEVIRHPA